MNSQGSLNCNLELLVLQSLPAYIVLLKALAFFERGLRSLDFPLLSPSSPCVCRKGELRWQCSLINNVPSESCWSLVIRGFSGLFLEPKASEVVLVLFAMQSAFLSPLVKTIVMGFANGGNIFVYGGFFSQSPLRCLLFNFLCSLFLGTWKLLCAIYSIERRRGPWNYWSSYLSQPYMDISTWSLSKVHSRKYQLYFAMILRGFSLHWAGISFISLLLPIFCLFTPKRRKWGYFPIFLLIPLFFSFRAFHIFLLSRKFFP